MGAITSIQQRLKLYYRLPDNGLAIFCGTASNHDDEKTKKFLLDFEPFAKIVRSSYLCDNKFHVEELEAMLEAEQREAIGFIVVDGR